jgi:chemotaxis protein histidine kinase CheA
MGFKNKNKDTKKVKSVIAQDGDTILRVEPYMHFGKHTLRPFSVDGLPVFLPKGIEKEKKLYTCKGLRDLLDNMNSELCRRPAIGLSEKCASIADFVAWSTENPEAPKAFTELMALFSKPEGQSFIDACNYMNSNSDAQRETKESVKHVDTYVSFLKDNSDEIEKVLRKGMLVSTRMLLACASCFECLALADNMKAWAKKIAPVKQQHKSVRAWIDDPDNLKKAKKALVMILQDNAKKKKLSKKSKLDSESSSSDDKKKKTKKSKKANKESSDDSSSDDKKKVKKDKKKTKKDSSESSAAEAGSDSSDGKKGKAKESKKRKKDSDDDSEDKATKKKKKVKSSSSASSNAKEKKAEKRTRRSRRQSPRKRSTVLRRPPRRRRRRRQRAHLRHLRMTRRRRRRRRTKRRRTAKSRRQSSRTRSKKPMTWQLVWAVLLSRKVRPSCSPRLWLLPYKALASWLEGHFRKQTS